MDVRKLDEKYLGRDVPAIPLEIVGAKGNYLYGADGREYLDFVMGWCVGNIGWNIKEVEDEIRSYEGPDYVNPYYLYKPWIELAELLAQIVPGKLVKSFRATGGTEAVELAMQAAISKTKREKFISVEGAYHGHSFGAMSIGSPYFRDLYHNLLGGCYKVKPPLDRKAALEVEKLLRNRDVAAYISEPIICNLGAIVPEQEYFDIVQEACKKYGTVLIIDEVATGFGRTGKFFGAQWYGLEPDIMCFGKAITGGYGALGATIMTEEIAKSMEYNFSFYSTFGWHPRNTIAALANLRYLLKHKELILENTRKLSDHFTERLLSMKFKYKPEIRIKGLAIGLEFRQEGYAAQIINSCLEKGLLISDLGPLMFTIFPALTIDQQSAKKGLDILQSCL